MDGSSIHMNVVGFAENEPSKRTSAAMPTSVQSTLKLLGALSGKKRLRKTRVVYLIHFSRKIGNLSNTRACAQHYIGYADKLPDRIQAHLEGRGAKIMHWVTKEGIEWWVVRVWAGSRVLERSLKNRKKAADFCPICKGKSHV